MPENQAQIPPGASAKKNEAGVFSSPAPMGDLERVARNIRRNIVTMIGRAGSGHPGGSLSATDILVALYFGVMQHRPQDPCWVGRDRFILSKGHAAPALYATLAECGYLPTEELATLRLMDSRLQGHTDRTLCPGIEMSAGALGQGLSFASGCALAGRLNQEKHRVFVLLGDGECDEGQVWEAAMAAPHFGLDRLCAIVDNNGLQIDGWNRDVMNLEPFAAKWTAFGWRVVEVDGHDIPSLIRVLGAAGQGGGKPTAVIAHTIKGKGVSFMENNPDFHGKAPTAKEVEIALRELE